MRKRGKYRTIGFLVLTVCLVFITGFCITGTVISQSGIGEREMENYYREQERKLVRETWDYLNRAGFQNSGITLNRVVDEDGSREYTMTIHHGKIDKMDENSRKTLKEDLSKFIIAEDNCNFCHEFLVTDWKE